MRKNRPLMLILAGVLLSATASANSGAQKNGNVSVIINKDEQGQSWLMLKLDDQRSRVKLPELAMDETKVVKSDAGTAFTFLRDSEGLKLQLDSGRVIKLPLADQKLDKEKLLEKIRKRREARHRSEP